MRRSSWVVAVASVWVALLPACGGGLYVGVGLSDDEDDNTPPAVSLVASPSSVGPGDTVRLSAAAADASGIEQVAFYRLDAGRQVLLGTDDVSPFEWQEAAPSGVATLSYFARATDRSGERGDSAIVTVSVRP